MLALAGFHARVLLVDHIDPPATAHDAAIFVAHLGRLQAVTYSHDPDALLGKNERREIRAGTAYVKAADASTWRGAVYAAMTTAGKT
jgi:hypothetical protein